MHKPAFVNNYFFKVCYALNQMGDQLMSWGWIVSNDKEPKYKSLGKMEIGIIIALIICCLLLV